MTEETTPTPATTPLDETPKGRMREIAAGSYYHECATDFTDGYRVTVGWSEEDQTWMAQVSGCAHSNAALADGPTKESALLSLVCSMASLLDAVEDDRAKAVAALPVPPVARSGERDVILHAAKLLREAASDYETQKEGVVGFGKELLSAADALALYRPAGERTLPDGVHRAFVDGAKWWMWRDQLATMFPSERDEAEAEAVKRYGPVVAGPSREEVEAAIETLVDEARNDESHDLLADSSNTLQARSALLALYRPAAPAGETRAGTVRGTVYAWETGQMSLVADPSIPIGEVQVRDEHGNVLMRIVGFDTALPPSHAGEANG